MREPRSRFRRTATSLQDTRGVRGRYHAQLNGLRPVLADDHRYGAIPESIIDRWVVGKYVICPRFDVFERVCRVRSRRNRREDGIPRWIGESDEVSIGPAPKPRFWNEHDFDSS